MKPSNRKKQNETKNENSINNIIEEQNISLDDTDCYASVWADLQIESEKNGTKPVWGGRGKGGRGLARRTVQPNDIVIEGVFLEYVADGINGSYSKTILDGAINTVLKLLGSHIYALVGRNGSGKSTLLRRIFSKKIPGFPSHLTSMYIPQEVFGLGLEHDISYCNKEKVYIEQDETITPVTLAQRYHESYNQKTYEANRYTIEQIENQINELDLSIEENCIKMETLCEQISSLEEENEEHDINETSNRNQMINKQIVEALEFFSVPSDVWNKPMSELSGGIRKKVLLACVLIYNPDILMLDEPTNHLDITGILQLRHLISTCAYKRKTTILIVSHDIDLINDVATDVIHLWNHSLHYYPGNYANFEKVKEQNKLHQLRQHSTLERQRNSMIKTIDQMKKQKSTNKNGKMIQSRKKKLERHGIEKNAHGHRWTVQNAGTGIKAGSINSIDKSTRSKLSYTELLKQAEANTAPIPDKAVQFVFQNTTSSWGEPLIMAMDVGHGYDTISKKKSTIQSEEDKNNVNEIANVFSQSHKMDGMLFDCVDLCINEGSRTFILGTNGSGKSTLLKILAKYMPPKEGTIHHAHGLNIGYFDQHIADDFIQNATEHMKTNNKTTPRIITPLSYLQSLFPLKSEQDLRGELSSFGLHGNQVNTNIRYLSGGERCRLCLSILMLKSPHVLILDEPTNHLDVESVNALIYGIQNWNGTVIIVSHDANFIRMVDGDCFLLVEEEGKLKRIPDGIDFYLKHFFEHFL